MSLDQFFDFKIDERTRLHSNLKISINQTFLPGAIIKNIIGRKKFFLKKLRIFPLSFFFLLIIQFIFSLILRYG